MPWRREKVVVRGKTFTDHVDPDTGYRAEQGHHHEEAAAGRPWCLISPRGEEMAFVPSLADVKRTARGGA